MEIRYTLSTIDYLKRRKVFEEDVTARLEDLPDIIKRARSADIVTTVIGINLEITFPYPYIPTEEERRRWGQV